MVLYLCSIRELEDASVISLLTPERQKRLARYRQEADRRRCLGAGLLLRYLLQEDAAHVRADHYGRLSLPGESLSFNLSHSGEFVALAADEESVGVDVEVLAPVADGIAERCYTPEELRWLYGQRDFTAAFYRLWTGKESVMKAVGLGFSMPPETFSIFEPVNGLHRIQGQNWYLNWYPLDGHSLCIASKRNIQAEIHLLSFSELIRL